MSAIDNKQLKAAQAEAATATDTYGTTPEQPRPLPQPRE